MCRWRWWSSCRTSWTIRPAAPPPGHVAAHHGPATIAAGSSPTAHEGKGWFKTMEFDCDMHKSPSSGQLGSSVCVIMSLKALCHYDLLSRPGIKPKTSQITEGLLQQLQTPTIYEKQTQEKQIHSFSLYNAYFVR